MKTRIENQETRNDSVINSGAVEINGVKLSEEAIAKIERWSNLKDGIFKNMFDYFLEDFENHLEEIQDVDITVTGELFIKAKTKNYGNYNFLVTESLDKAVSFLKHINLYKRASYVMPGQMKYFNDKITRVSDDVDGFQKFKDGKYYIVAVEQ